jgi:hypothetical protein
MRWFLRTALRGAILSTVVFGPFFAGRHFGISLWAAGLFTGWLFAMLVGIFIAVDEHRSEVS